MFLCVTLLNLSIIVFILLYLPLLSTNLKNRVIKTLPGVVRIRAMDYEERGHTETDYFGNVETERNGEISWMEYQPNEEVMERIGEIQTDRKKQRQRETDTVTEANRERETERETDRNIQRQTETYNEKQTDRQRKWNRTT